MFCLGEAQQHLLDSAGPRTSIIGQSGPRFWKKNTRKWSNLLCNSDFDYCKSWNSWGAELCPKEHQLVENTWSQPYEKFRWTEGHTLKQMSVKLKNCNKDYKTLKDHSISSDPCNTFPFISLFLFFFHQPCFPEHKKAGLSLLPS